MKTVNDVIEEWIKTKLSPALDSERGIKPSKSSKKAPQPKLPGIDNDWRDVDNTPF